MASADQPEAEEVGAGAGGTDTVEAVLPTAPVRDFGSDNRSGISPDALAGVVAANGAPRRSSYGEDPETKKASTQLCELFGREVLATWVPTGTAANVAAIGALLDGPGSAVVVGCDSHVLLDEAGAVQRVWGVPLLPAGVTDGKLTPEAVEAVLGMAAANQPFSPTPSVLSVTNLSEKGRRHTAEEIAALSALAGRHGMKLHIDGARFANALASDPALIDVFDTGVATLAFGCAKNGQGPVEAVLTTDPVIHARVGRAAKQLGWTMSKMRYATAGVGESLASGEFTANAAAANRKAAQLAARLTEAGIPPELPVEGNLVFVRLPVAVVEPLDTWCHVSRWDGNGLVRLACSWDHSEDDVETLAAGIAELLRVQRPAPV